MTNTQAMLDLANRFFAAVGAGDIEAVRAIYAPDAVIWYAHTGAVQTVADNLRTLGLIAKHISGFGYDDRRLIATETGFVEQHITRGVTPGGVAFSIPACIVCVVEDGRITRLDEYFDSAAAAPLLSG